MMKAQLQSGQIHGARIVTNPDKNANPKRRNINTVYQTALAVDIINL